MTTIGHITAKQPKSTERSSMLLELLGQLKTIMARLYAVRQGIEIRREPGQQRQQNKERIADCAKALVPELNAEDLADILQASLSELVDIEPKENESKQHLYHSSGTKSRPITASLEVLHAVLESSGESGKQKSVGSEAERIFVTILNLLKKDTHELEESMSERGIEAAFSCLTSLAARPMMYKPSIGLFAAALDLHKSLGQNFNGICYYSVGKFCMFVATLLRYHPSECGRLATLIIAAAQKFLETAVNDYLRTHGFIQSYLHTPHHACMPKINFRDQHGQGLGKLYENLVECKEVSARYSKILLAGFLETTQPIHFLDSVSHSEFTAVVEAWKSLRQHALPLYGACQPHEIQQLYTCLRGKSAESQLSELSWMKKGYEEQIKFSG